MIKPKYTSAARQDLVDILTYISRDKPGAAIAWIEKIEVDDIRLESDSNPGHHS
jgi:plasmid stabilization system protein ParE